MTAYLAQQAIRKDTPAWWRRIIGAAGHGARDGKRASRQLRVETLEARTVLSASVTVLPPAPVDTPTAQEVPALVPADPTPPADAKLDAVDVLQITAVHLRMGDQVIIVTSNNQVVPVRPGAQLQVIGIDFALSPRGAGLPGAIAFEGYLRKIPKHGGRGRFDYHDGRFGRPDTHDPLAVGTHTHSGLKGGWKMESGYDRLALAMVRYAGADAHVEARFFINLEVQQPDFLITKVDVSHGGRQKALVVGRQVPIRGQWENAGAGTYFNYAEVDVYRQSDLSRPAWVGTLAGTARPGHKVKGEYLNRSDHDHYPRRWTPVAADTYILKFYADPEDVWRESNEANNVRTMTLAVVAPTLGKPSRVVPDQLLETNIPRGTQRPADGAKPVIVPAAATAHAPINSVTAAVHATPTRTRLGQAGMRHGISHDQIARVGTALDAAIGPATDQVMAAWPTAVRPARTGRGA